MEKQTDCQWIYIYLFIYFPDDITNRTLETSSKINMKITSTWTWDTSFPDLNQERVIISLPAFLISGKQNDMEVSSDKTVKSSYSFVT